MRDGARLAAAEAALRAHQSSWTYAFAYAGGCQGGGNHPDHRATRDLTERLLSDVLTARGLATIPHDLELPDDER